MSDEIEPVAIRRAAAARMLGVSLRQLDIWVRHGVVPSFKQGGTRLFPVEGLRRWVADRQRVAVAAIPHPESGE